MDARAGAHASQKGDPDRLRVAFVIDLPQLQGNVEILSSEATKKIKDALQC
jgi:hypothetical protein